jgi:tRNA(Ile)-lysidine synthase
MIKKLQKHLHESQVLAEGVRVLIACSGGADSTALLYLMHQLGYTVEVAHVNYQLRGEASQKAEDYLDELCKKLDLPYHVKRFNTQELASDSKRGIQELARHLRYQWFEQLSDELGIPFILTAHHQNDRIESYTHHLLRGNSLSGFSSIPQQRGKIFRPLLQFTQEELRNYLNEIGVEWVEDESNAGLDYTRNKIRHQLLPLMSEIHEGFEHNFLRQMEMFKELNHFLSDFMQNLGQRAIRAEASGLFIDLEVLEQLSFKRLLIMHLAPQFGFDLKRTDEWLRLIDSQNGKTIYSGTHRVIRERGALLITPLPERLEEESFLIHETLEKNAEELDLELAFLELTPSLLREIKQNRDERCAYLDADALLFPLLYRPWTKGDRFQPLGMNGKQLLSDFFTQKKVNQVEKESAFVLESAGEIVWVVGHRIAHGVRLKEGSSRVLRLKKKE